MPFPQMNQNISHIFISSLMSFLLFFISRKIKILSLLFIRHLFNHFYQFFKVFCGSHNQICLISRSSHFFHLFFIFWAYPSAPFSRYRSGFSQLRFRSSRFPRCLWQLSPVAAFGVATIPYAEAERLAARLQVVPYTL